MFFGGAAGGGKSDVLLMRALQYVHVRGYAALILRKDTKRLKRSGGLIPRAHEWLAPHPDVRWNGTDNRFTFPSGATIEFSYLDNPNDKYGYGSTEFQFIGFDELTDFREEDYVFLKSRLRKTVSLDVPLLIASASNPGGPGHFWVKTYFISKEAEKALQQGEEGIFWKEGRAFIPSKIKDNPAISLEEYSEQLRDLPAVFRERLMNGDWSIQENSLIREDYLRYYTQQGEFIELRDQNDEIFARVDQRNCHRFATCDPAGTSQDIAKEKRAGTGAYSHSVIQVWDKVPGNIGPFILLRHCWRKQVGFNDLCDGLKSIQAEFRPSRILIENEKLGVAATDVLQGKIPIQTIATKGQDKVTRAGKFLNKCERGEVFLPKYNADWKAGLEAEWLAWTGHKDEPADQIDAAAYAALSAETGGSWGGVINV